MDCGGLPSHCRQIVRIKREEPQANGGQLKPLMSAKFPRVPAPRLRKACSNHSPGYCDETKRREV
jgi:hypothetical protein